MDISTTPAEIDVAVPNLPVSEITQGVITEGAITEPDAAGTDVAGIDVAGIDVTAGPQLFETFYAASAESVARALAATLNDRELASDATNEAMTRAYQRWTKISKYDNPEAWVYRVGLNWSLSWKQRRRRERVRPIKLMPDEVELAARDHSLDGVLAQLSLEHRAVVVCRIHLDWSVDQTAEALKIAPGTVKSRLSRALDHLRSLIEAEGGQPCR